MTNDAALAGDLDALELLREPTRRRLYDYVVEAPSPVDRDQAASALGIRRSLAAFHLDKLVGARLLRAGYRRASSRSGPGVGRPSKLYGPSRRRFQVSVPQREHELLAGFLAGSLPAVADDVVRNESAHEYGRSLGALARRRLRGEASQERLLRCIKDVLSRLGFVPYVASGTGVAARNCPFGPLSARFPPVVCGAAVSLVKGIVDGVDAPSVEVGREPPKSPGCCIHIRTRLDRP